MLLHAGCAKGRCANGEFAIFALQFLKPWRRKATDSGDFGMHRAQDSGMPGTSRYVTTKNRKNTPDRMEIKKFNPVLRRYTLHKEIK